MQCQKIQLLPKLSDSSDKVSGHNVQNAPANNHLVCSAVNIPNDLVSFLRAWRTLFADVSDVSLRDAYRIPCSSCRATVPKPSTTTYSAQGRNAVVCTHLTDRERKSVISETRCTRDERETSEPLSTDVFSERRDAQAPWQICMGLSRRVTRHLGKRSMCPHAHLQRFASHGAAARP